MQRSKQWIRDQDLFAVPVTLMYKNQKAFNTLLGGSCTLIMYVTFVTILGFMANEALRNPYYQSSSIKSFSPYYENDTPFLLNTSETTIAIQIKSDDALQAYVNHNFRVVFSAYSSETGDLTRISAAYCSDVYADQIATEERSGKVGFFTSEFARSDNREWICPNTTEIAVLNDPSTERR